MKRTLAAAALLLVTAGCDTTLFAPAGNDQVTAFALKSFEEMSFIKSCVDLGTCHRSGDFSSVEDHYVQALASIDAATELANKTFPTSGRAGEATALLLENFDLCKEQIKLLARFHQSDPNLQDDPLPALARTTCLIAWEDAASL
ncbi:MAG: hypothetical protein AAFX00_04250 [Pseudomonadota bacterium]